MKNFKKESYLIVIPIVLFFIIFYFSWLTNAGTYVYGLYSEVDGQLYAGLATSLVKWGKVFDINTLNPFQGMGSVFIPANSWWNPAALVLSLSHNKTTNFLLSYSIYWIEIFVAIYFLAKLIGLNKIESVFAAESFVLFLFPPFSGYFKTIPYFSLVPVFAHCEALVILMVIAYARLGEGGLRYNVFWAVILIATSYIGIMSMGFLGVCFIPVYTLFALGYTIQRSSQPQLIWKIGVIFILIGLFIFFGGHRYYMDTTRYVSASSGGKLISFSTPIWQKHSSIFYVSPPLYFFLHLYALIGGVIGAFYQKKKYRWISWSFIIIVLMPDVLQFIFENHIATGGIQHINSSYYLWCAYPLYCIFFTISLSFLWSVFRKVIFYDQKNFIVMNKRGALKITRIYSFLDKYSKLLVLLICPFCATFIWISTLSIKRVAIPEFKKTPIVSYLKKQTSINPNDVFRGTTAAYFASQGTYLRQLFGFNKDNSNYSMQHYIDTREFLNARFGNRHMFTDLWSFNIPTLEEYGQWITLPMYIFFKEMLAREGDVLNRHFINLYKLNVKVIEAMGVRYIITDKILHRKDLSLVMEQNQPVEGTGFVDYNVTLSAKNIFNELLNNFKDSTVARVDFVNIFKQKLDELHPTKLRENQKVIDYLDSAIKSALKKERTFGVWSPDEISKIQTYFNIVLSVWMASPPLYLYETKSPNIASYSPINPIQINSAKELFAEMNKSNFSFKKSVIVQDDLPKLRLVAARNSDMRFEPNAVKIKAESNGWSLLLLPLQYSHCFKVVYGRPADKEAVHLLRANLIQGALLFKEKLDIQLNFNFGMGRNSHCRQKDIQDMVALGLLNK